MNAPQDGTCRICKHPYTTGEPVTILTVNHLDSPLVRLAHKGCAPLKRKPVAPHVATTRKQR